MERIEDESRRGGAGADGAAGQRPRLATGPTAEVGNRHARPRYGILGGTFDPPHLGHLILAQELYVRLGLDRVWFIPAREPPHKAGRAVTPAADRLAMVELAIAGDVRFACSPVELHRPGPSYTVETLRELRAAWAPSVELYFVLGWDMLLYLPNWREPEGVLAALDGLVAVHRPGVEPQPQDQPEALAALEARLPALREKLILLPMPQIELSSSMIRERVACGLPIRYLVPDTVCQYIEQHGLYRPRAEQPAHDQHQGQRTAAGEEEPA